MNHGSLRPPAVPILKWAGGKRWLAPYVRELVRDVPFSRYHEPFLGSGAVFFHLGAPPAYLGDTNSSLLEAYRALKANPERIFEILDRWRFDVETHALVRAADYHDRWRRAARLLFLNRTSFNGLYRVNRAGRFNVPFGCKPGTTRFKLNELEVVARGLKQSRLTCGDFFEALRLAEPGDLVYADPPYVTSTRHPEQFARYNQACFTWSDQERLAKCLNELVESGVHVEASNASDVACRKLYSPDAFVRIIVARKSRMAASVAHRSYRTELLVMSRSVASRRRARRVLAELDLRTISAVTSHADLLP